MRESEREAQTESDGKMLRSIAVPRGTERSEREIIGGANAQWQSTQNTCGDSWMEAAYGFWTPPDEASATKPPPAPLHKPSPRHTLSPLTGKQDSASD